MTSSEELLLQLLLFETVIHHKMESKKLFSDFILSLFFQFGEDKSSPVFHHLEHFSCTLMKNLFRFLGL